MRQNDNSVLYIAVYDDVDAAMADLEAFEGLHDAEVIGKYDAAVIDKHDGKPHIVKRVDHPRINVIPETFGHGALPSTQLKEAADELTTDQVGLIVVGEATLDNAFENAVTRAARTAKREFNTATDKLASEMTQAVRT